MIHSGATGAGAGSGATARGGGRWRCTLRDSRSGRGTGGRGAELSGADLTGSLFVTQFQLASAKGDQRTQVDPPLTRPAHWLSAGT